MTTQHHDDPQFSDPLEARLRNRLRAIADGQHAPAYLRERIVLGIAGETAADTVVTPVRRPVWQRWDVLAGAATGALVATAAAAVLWIAQPNPVPAPSLAGEAWFDVALNRVTGPALLQTDQPAELRTWLESQVDHMVDVPDIPEATLTGGRLAYVGGVRGAAVEYDYKGTALTYLMVPAEQAFEQFDGVGDTVVTWSSRGYQIVMWRQSGDTRALVAPIPLEALFGIADHCRRTMI